MSESTTLVLEEEQRVKNMLMIELLSRCGELEERHSECANCEYDLTNLDSDEIVKTYIYWHKYNFCGEWCRFDRESSIRKSYIMYHLHLKKKSV